MATAHTLLAMRPVTAAPEPLLPTAPCGSAFPWLDASLTRTSVEVATQVPPPPPPPSPPPPPLGLCPCVDDDTTCPYTNDGNCDDGGEGSQYALPPS